MAVETQRGPSGELYVLQGGRWRAASAQEQQALDTPDFEAFGAQLGQRAANLLDTVLLGANALFPMGGGEAVRDRIQSRQETFDPLNRTRPDTGAMATGALELALAPLGGGTGSRAAAVASATTARLGAREGLRTSTGLIRRPSNVLGRGTTAGSVARLVEGGLEAVPGLNIPGLAQKALNQRTINESFARAMGLADDVALHARTAGADDRVIGATLDMFERGYGRVAGALDNTVDQAAARSLIESAEESGFLVSKRLRSLIDKPRLDGKDIMAVRSQLAKVSRSNENFLVTQRAGEMVDELDTFIIEAVEQGGDDAARATVQSLNARYKVFREIRKGRSIGKDGMVNPSAADSRFSTAFGDRYAAGRVQTADDGVNRFLRTVREGAELDVGLPSSGTAERAALGALLLGGGAAVSQ